VSSSEHVFNHFKPSGVKWLHFIMFTAILDVFNPFKPSGVKWSHFTVFTAILDVFNPFKAF